MNALIGLKPTSFGTQLGGKKFTKLYASLEQFRHKKSREKCKTLLPSTFSTCLEGYVG